MQRYFARCAYQGSSYCGWQRQSHDPSVQQTIEEKLSLALRSEIKIVGCGRTDAGVHASEYYFHFDSPLLIDSKLSYSIKSLMPVDIVIYKLIPVDQEAHARYDAISRRYRYQIRTIKHPFQQDYYYTLPEKTELDQSALELGASIISELNDFEIFSKTGSDVDHYLCSIMQSNWEIQDQEYVYTIKANRFLRGMVRLLVGMQLNLALGKLSEDDVRSAISSKSYLNPNFSVPPQGLFLDQVLYANLQDTEDNLP